MCEALICRLVRPRTAELARGNSCAFRVTQADLADATGLSTVHVNRTSQELRSTNLIWLTGRSLKLLDLERLMQVALFHVDYLHLDREGAHLDANI